MTSFSIITLVIFAKKIIERVLLADMDKLMGDDTYNLDLTPKQPAVEKSQSKQRGSRRG
jgi:hypothetical protein